MNSSTKNQEKQYYGLLGLDRLPRIIKSINLFASVIIGTLLAFAAWFNHVYEGLPWYIAAPFLPLLFIWPLCAVLLWLRLTGIPWKWCFIAGGIVLFGYCILHFLGALLASYLAS